VKIAIAGAGVAGSYLACMLTKYGYDIEVFESSKKENHWPICAWGTSRDLLSRFSEKAGLNFEDYLLYVGGKARIVHSDNTVELADLPDLATYDKRKWESDLLRDVRITYGVRCTSSSFPFDDFDYVIDCTGVHRELLPKPCEDFIIPSYEYLVENVHDIDYFSFINYKDAKGYLWYFPLKDGRGYIGAGDFDRKYEGLQNFFEQHPQAKILKKVGRPIRLSPPTRMTPLHRGNTIGVGESIGCVFPITGEGIAPSLYCCDIFIDVFNKSRRGKFDFEQYQKQVFKKFEFYEDAYRILKLLTQGRLAYRFGDLINLVTNNFHLASTIREARETLELLSVANKLGERFQYPIISHEDFHEKMCDLYVGDGTTLSILRRVIPELYYPLKNREDLEDALAMLAEHVEDVLLLGHLDN
jgi:flavin-dependent dehydrogenase